MQLGAYPASLAALQRPVLAPGAAPIAKPSANPEPQVARPAEGAAERGPSPASPSSESSAASESPANRSASVALDPSARAAAQAQRIEQQQIAQLASRDREVRAHEQAHAAVGGQYASAPSYTYTRGPDGARYAVAGEVGIDVAAVPGDPEATLRKMEVVVRAALAPAEPSAQDRRVAAQAQAQLAQARVELAALQRDQITGKQADAARPSESPQASEAENASQPPQAEAEIQVYREVGAATDASTRIDLNA